MGQIKRLLEDYVFAKHPFDEDAQDDLFEDICDGVVQISLEEMQFEVEGIKNHEDFTKTEN